MFLPNYNARLNISLLTKRRSHGAHQAIDMSLLRREGPSSGGKKVTFSTTAPLLSEGGSQGRLNRYAKIGQLHRNRNQPGERRLAAVNAICEVGE